MKQSKITMEEWLQEIALPYKTERPKNSFTLSEFQKKHKLKRGLASAILQKQIDSGVATKVKVLENGKWAWLYIINDNRVL